MKSMLVVDLLGTLYLCIHALIVVTEQASKFHVGQPHFGKIWGMQVVKAMPLCGVCPLTACSEQMVDNYRETEQNSDLVRSGNNI